MLLATRPLSEYPRAIDVDPACEAAVSAAISHARALGLVLPAHVVLWVQAPGAGALAETHVRNGERVAIYMRADLGPHQTFAATLHELQHVADRDLVDRLPAAELEDRAVAFAARALHAYEGRTITTMPTTTNGLQDARRAALGREGHAIADRAERERRLLTPSERRRFDEILVALGPPRRAASPLAPAAPGPRRHLMCGGAVFGPPGALWGRCFGCGAVVLGR